MAIYRHIQVDFWQDSFVLDLTPEEKLCYMYLMSNAKTSQCGIYELPIKLMAVELGYSRETVEKLLDRFEEYGKIIYCKKTKEIFIRNWMKHNKATSPKVRMCVVSELKKVKNKGFVRMFLDICSKLGYSFDEVVVDDCDVLVESDVADDVCEDVGCDIENSDADDEMSDENEKTVDVGLGNEVRVSVVSDVAVFARLYQENVGVVNGYVREWLLEVAEKIDVMLFKKAIGIAVSKGKCTQGYVNGIIRKWENSNIRCFEDFRAYEVGLKNSGGGYFDGSGVKREVVEEDEDLYAKPTKEQLDKARSWGK